MTAILIHRKKGVADSMYENDFGIIQNPCRDVAVLRLDIRIHTSIQQRRKKKQTSILLIATVSIGGLWT
ncbi:hypothetical protein [Mastigocladopsis repens]|uniref:hypothetical protein n=1 Tax=Mastigocladopsis repens TaxID=221287 RepID=UPI001E5F5317|nr:hypothetical protein [Mastigocladopsis repens]